MTRIKLVGFLSVFVFTQATEAYEPPSNLPKFSHQPVEQLAGLEVKENQGHQINLQRTFTNEAGETVPLGKYYDGHRPVLLSMVYYGCPSLCSYHLNGLLDTLKGMKQPVGSDFQIVVVSMNHNESSELAAQKKENYIKALGQVGAEKGFHFLVGNEENIKGLAEELGFPFRWIEAEQQYAHPAVLHVTTPTGVISRYLHGIQFESKALRFALLEAAKGKIGDIIEQFTLFCYKLDPKSNTLTFFHYNIMRMGAGLTVLLLAAYLIPVWMRERRRTRGNRLGTVKGET